MYLSKSKGYILCQKADTFSLAFSLANILHEGGKTCAEIGEQVIFILPSQ